MLELEEVKKEVKEEIVVIQQSLKEIEHSLERIKHYLTSGKCKWGYIKGIYHGILDREPGEAEFDYCYDLLYKSDAGGAAGTRRMAMELIKSTEFQKEIRNNYTCEEIISNFLEGILCMEYSREKFDFYVNCCKSDNKSQHVCEHICECIVEELLNSNEFKELF
jgi:hypothetical protein